MAYDASQNTWLFGAVKNMAFSLQDNRDEARRLVEFWFKEGVSGSPEFQDLPPNTQAELTAMITLFQNYEEFYTNIAVAAADRASVLTPWLAGR